VLCGARLARSSTMTRKDPPFKPNEWSPQFGVVGHGFGSVVECVSTTWSIRLDTIAKASSAADCDGAPSGPMSFWPLPMVVLSREGVAPEVADRRMTVPRETLIFKNTLAHSATRSA